jgi:hypothetical protein
MIRYLVKESLASQGVQAAAEVSNPRELSPKVRDEHSNGVVVLCLSGPPEIWRNTITETRRTLPGGRLVAVTFGHDAPHPDARATDARLGADSIVKAPSTPPALREAVLKARLVRAGPTPAGSAPAETSAASNGDHSRSA